jgi:hypothetical protein
MTTQEFNALPQNEKAVLVAKDVLAQLECGKFKPIVNVYISTNQTVYDLGVNFDDDIKTNFDKLPQCQVCALGATLLSATHLGNLLTFRNINIARSSIEGINNEKVSELFESIFTFKQLLLIETAFENYISNATRFATDVKDELLTNDEITKCIDFYNSYTDIQDRMTAIFQNVIENNGVFKP